MLNAVKKDAPLKVENQVAIKKSLEEALVPVPMLQTKIGVGQNMTLKPPVICNLVATCNMNCKIDLRHLAQWCRNAEYNPSRFSAVVMRIRDPRTTALIFSTGKVVITGAKSEQDGYQAARIFEKTISKVQNEHIKKGEESTTALTEFKIQNIVASCDVGFSIKLESL